MNISWSEFIKKYKVGDKLLVARKYNKGIITRLNGLTGNFYWHSEMNYSIGKVGTVIKISSNFPTIILDIKGVCNYCYPLECLEEIKKISNYKRYENLKKAIKNLK
jgi:hypothetical protein